MIYVFDNSPLSALFRNYYKDRFPSLWKKFDEIVEGERLVSTREVLHEINDGSLEIAREWCKGKDGIFSAPDADEGKFVARIFSEAKFRHIIERQKILKGGRNADPFVIARAAVAKGTVVTMEKLKDNAVKIPNICEHFKIPCLSLEEFMEKEGWTF